MVQSIGHASGVVAAGATFVIPALYINQLDAAWWQILLACLFGGFLGPMLIFSLHKHFVKDLHGDLPFPEATAINEVLVTGRSASGGAGKVPLLTFVLGTFGQGARNISLEVNIAGIAAPFGLGYIIGIRYASIIASGSVPAVLVIVPTIEPVAFGAVAASGIIGIIRMGKIVVGSVTLGFKGLRGRTSITHASTSSTWASTSAPRPRRSCPRRCATCSASTWPSWPSASACSPM